MTEQMPEARLRRRVPGLRGSRGAALAFGIVLMVWLATRIVLATRFPLYGDEGIFASLTQLVWSNPEQRFVALIGNKGLLSTWTTGAMMGLGLGPVAAVRGYALLSGLVTLVATTALTVRIWGRRVAIAVAVVLVLLPYMLVYDVVAQYDPFIAAAAMVSLLLQLKLVQRARLDLALLLGLVLGAGLLTKQSGTFAVLLIPVSLVCFDWKGPALWRRLVSWIGCVVLALVLAFLIWALQYASPAAYLPVVENHRLLRDALPHPLRYLDQSFGPYFRTFVGYLTVPLLIPLLVGLVDALLTRLRITLVLLCWIAIPAAGAGLIATEFVARYTLQCVPPLAMFMGVGVVRIYTTARAHARLRVLILGLLGLLFAQAIVFDGLVLARPNEIRYPGQDDWQYMRSEQLAGPPLQAVIDTIRRGKAANPGVRLTVGSFNSFNVGEMDALLNGRHTGWQSPYILSGVDPTKPPTQKYLIIEKYILSPYFDWGTPLDELVGSPSPRGVVDSRYLQIRPYLRKYRLVLVAPRPRNGPSVYLYVRR
jgi:4-amino-4-deoxy-L-arabinose transferase-like glycosyltransferase